MNEKLRTLPFCTARKVGIHSLIHSSVLQIFRGVFTGGQQAVTQVGVDGATQRPGPAAASVPSGPAAPFPLVGAQHPLGEWRRGTGH